MNTGKTSLIQTRRFAVLLRRLALTIYSVEGSYDGRPMRLLVADDNDTLTYIRNLVFPNGAAVSRKGSILAPLATRLARSDADLVIAGVNQLLTGSYARKGFYLAPKFVRQVLPLPDGPDALLSRLSKSARGRIRNALVHWPDYEVTNEHSLLDLFYNRMYRPHTLARFGDQATVCSYERVESDFRRGALVLLRSDGHPVAGAVFFPDGPTLRIPYSGVMTGHEEIARKGSKIALYHYGMLLGYSWGCSEVNFGHSRPFLTDGILQFKMRWEPQVLDDDDGVASFAIAVPGRTEQALKFLAANPFYHVDNGRLTILQVPESQVQEGMQINADIRG